MRLFVKRTRARHAERGTLFLSAMKHKQVVRRVLESHTPCPSALVTYTPAKEPTTSNMEGCTAERVSRLDLESLGILRPRTRPSVVSGEYAGHLAVEMAAPLPRPPLVVTEHCGASLTRVLHLIVQLRYAHILFVGVDLMGSSSTRAPQPPPPRTHAPI